jgi:lipopolysaccharide/colanic/teichoic acid biosynthesis glycosyltransferase
MTIETLHARQPTLRARRTTATNTSSQGSSPLCSPFNLAIKQSLEIPLALAALVALMPVMVLVALTIRLTSPGGVIHRRRVAGRSGIEFDAFKFRTMVPDADERIRRDPALRREFEEKYKLTADPRVTPAGRVLRKFSLDELPQLVNVLKGQMSLVGPRMISPEEYPKYGPYVDKLLAVKPGLTGLWQVSGRQATTYNRRVELDMHYIDNWSLRLDLAILARTPLVVLRGKGAH